MATNGPVWTDAYMEERQPASYGSLRTLATSGATSLRTNGARNRNRSRSRSRGHTGRAAKRIEDVLQDMQHEWDFMTGDKCVPVQVALQLLDDSSLGLARRGDEFQDAQDQLQVALRAIVNEHHQGFNSSIGTFHQIQASIQISHERVRALKVDLVRAKSNLTSTKSEFQNLVLASNNFDDTLRTLETIEQVQQIPRLLESKISDKLFLSAVDILQEGLRLAQNIDLQDANALSEIRVYLSNQEHSLTDILLEELHNHLYLKSPYCEERWKTYAKIHRRDAKSDLSGSATRQLYNFLDSLNMDAPFNEDASHSPESDSFQYIQLLLEALNRLGHLEDAVEAVEQRLPVELFKVVERTNNEVQQRHPRGKPSNSVKTFADMAAETRTSALVLEDLLGILYGRFEAIAEAYRAFHDVIGGILRREDAKNTLKLTRAFKELWKLYQSEIRSLLRDYLSTDESSSGRSGQTALEGNIFRQQRDKNRKCAFKMDLVDSEAIELKLEEDEVVSYWQKFVPGLVSLQQSSASAITSTSQPDGSATGHKLLVEPSVFNITSLLPPSVSFLKRLRDLIPPGSDIVVSTLSSFLNDFLTNVFHPQLEETLVEMCLQSYVQIDAFQEDPQWARYAQKPIFKGSVAFVEVVSAFCQMLDELTHDQLFSQLVIKQMHAYHDKCVNWYRIMVTRAQARSSDGSNATSLKASAQLAHNPSLTAVLGQIWNATPDNTRAPTLEEARLLVGNSAISTLDDFDLISDTRTQHALCLLYTSMRWTAVKLSSLRQISPRADEDINAGMDSDTEERPQLKRSLTRALAVNNNRNGSEPIHLPLSESTAALFDGIVTGFRELSDTTLRTLRLEMRFQLMRGLHESFSGSLIYPFPSTITPSPNTSSSNTAVLAIDTTDSPDEALLAVLANLITFDTAMSTSLQAIDHAKITTGLSTTVDVALVHTMSQPDSLKALNAPAAKHLLTNVRVLQHNLLNIQRGSTLPQARAFLELFLQGNKAVEAEIGSATGSQSRTGLGREELDALQRLLYQSGKGGNNGTPEKTKMRTSMGGL